MIPKRKDLNWRGDWKLQVFQIFGQICAITEEEKRVKK